MSAVEQAHRQRWRGGVRELRPGEYERGDVVADLLDVGRRPCGILASLHGLVVEQVYQRGLCALDLGGDDGLLTDEGVDEPVQRRHHRAGNLEPGDALLRGAEARVETHQVERRILRRERIGDERAHGFAACNYDLVTTGDAGHGGSGGR